MDDCFDETAGENRYGALASGDVGGIEVVMLWKQIRYQLYVTIRPKTFCGCEETLLHLFCLMSSEVTRPVLTLHTPAMLTFLKLELEMMPWVLSKPGIGIYCTVC